MCIIHLLKLKMSNKGPHIIAICGLKRSGKDTIADILCNHFEYKKIKIATPLKDALKTLFNFTDEQVEGNEKDIIDPVWGVEPRRVMQFIGTEVMQYHIQELLPNMGRTFWIKRLIEEHIHKGTNERLVIPDLRFKHEYDLLSQHNTLFWRVDRPDIKHDECKLSMHSSEKEYLDIPVSHIFSNNGQIEKLEKEVCDLIKANSHITS